MDRANCTKWNIHDRNLEKASACTIRSTLVLLKENLNQNDERIVVSLSVGDPTLFPTFRTSPAAEDAVVDALRSGKFNGYGASKGILEARRAVAEYASSFLHPRDVSPDDVFITIGARQAIDAIISVLASSGANILLPKPGYPLYEARSAFSRLEARHFHLLPERGWEVDLEHLKSVADDRTVAMVIINPGNPCGNVFTYQHLKEIAETARELGILVISDEAYGHLTFGDTEFVSMATFGSIAPVLTIGSLSKRWMVPGWRLGWILISDSHDVLKNYKIVDRIRSYLDISADPATFIQGALPQILKQTPQTFFSETLAILKEASDICYARLKEIPCFSPCKARGSMFLMAKLDLSMLEGINDDMEFCINLAREESMTVLPGVCVGLKNWVRITFAVEISVLEEGLGRVRSFCLRHAKFGVGTAILLNAGVGE